MGGDVLIGRSIYGIVVIDGSLCSRFYGTTKSCKMVFPGISYVVYSVNYFIHLLITHFVYSEYYHVVTTRTNQSGGIKQINHTR